MSSSVYLLLLEELRVSTLSQYKEKLWYFMVSYGILWKIAKNRGYLWNLKVRGDVYGTFCEVGWWEAATPSGYL